MRVSPHGLCTGFALALLAAGCGGSSTPDLTGKNLTGVLDNGAVVALQVGSTSQAALTTTAASTAATTNSVTGTVTLASGTAGTVSGSYDPTTAAFSVTGTLGTESFSLTGTYTKDALSGSYSLGSITGKFIAFLGGTSTVTRYCGTYTGDAAGVFMVVVSGSSAHAVVSGDGGFVMGGSASSAGELSLTGNNVTATGTLTSSGVSGSWTKSDGSKGGWSGSTALCPSST